MSDTFEVDTLTYIQQNGDTKSSPDYNKTSPDQKTLFLNLVISSNYRFATAGTWFYYFILMK